MSIQAIERAYYLLVFAFSRQDFYLELSDSWRRMVSLKNFAYRLIENGKILRDQTRIYIGGRLVANIEQNQGVGLWESLKGIVPKNDWPLLRAAEGSKDIPSAILHIAKVIEFKNKIVKSLFLQGFVVLVVVVLCGGMIYITADTIAKIMQTAPNLKFTGFNGLVVFLASFFMEYWKEILVFIAVAVALVIHYSSRLIGSFREKIDEMPLLSIYRDIESANAIAMLSMFLSSGLVLKEALNRLAFAGTPWRKWQVSKITSALDSRPNELMYAFSRGLFSPKLRARLAALTDSSSAFEQAIITLGRDELERIESEIQKTVIAAAGTLIFIFASVAVVLSLGQQTIISQLYNEFSKGY